MPPSLTIENAYDIAKYYYKTGSHDGAIIASDMTLLSDNRPVDDAVLEEWFEALHFTKPHEDFEKETAMLTIDEAYSAMIKFLEIYCSMGADDSFIEFVEGLKTKTSTIYPFKTGLIPFKKLQAILHASGLI